MKVQNVVVMIFDRMPRLRHAADTVVQLGAFPGGSLDAASGALILESPKKLLGELVCSTPRSRHGACILVYPQVAALSNPLRAQAYDDGGLCPVDMTRLNFLFRRPRSSGPELDRHCHASRLYRK